MNKTNCPRCGFSYTCFSINAKPRRCKCGTMIKGGFKWKKLLIIVVILLLLQIIVGLLFKLQIPAGALIGVLIIVAMKLIEVEEVASRDSGKVDTPIPVEAERKSVKGDQEYRSAINRWSGLIIPAALLALGAYRLFPILDFWSTVKLSLMYSLPLAALSTFVSWRIRKSFPLSAPLLGIFLVSLFVLTFFL